MGCSMQIWMQSMEYATTNKNVGISMWFREINCCSTFECGFFWVTVARRHRTQPSLDRSCFSHGPLTHGRSWLKAVPTPAPTPTALLSLLEVNRRTSWTCRLNILWTQAYNYQHSSANQAISPETSPWRHCLKMTSLVYHAAMVESYILDDSVSHNKRMI